MIWSRLVAESGRAEILKLLFLTRIFEILAKTLDSSVIRESGPLGVTAQCSYFSIHRPNAKFQTDTPPPPPPPPRHFPNSLLVYQLLYSPSL